MKKLLLLGLISCQLNAADLIFKHGFENAALVAGSVTGLNSAGLSIKLSFGTSEQILVIATSGSFTFSPEVPIGANWTVVVETQPSNPCTLSNASGTMTASGVGNVLVSCTDSVDNWDEMNWNQGRWN